MIYFHLIFHNSKISRPQQYKASKSVIYSYSLQKNIVIKGVILTRIQREKRD